MRQFTQCLVILLFISAPVMAKQRLVVADGSITEIVYALGAEANLVAVDTTSLYPPQTKSLPSIGYLRALNAEGILALNPSELITTSSAGPLKTLEDLQNAGVKVRKIDTPFTAQGIVQKIEQVGELLGKQAQAEQLKNNFKSELDTQLKVLQDKFAKPTSVLIFLGMQGNQLMASGRGTQADAVLKLMGWQNAGADFEGYKPLSQESLLKISADVIIVLQHSPERKPDTGELFTMTKAARNKRLLFVDSSKMLGFGIRLPEALAQINSDL